MSDRKTKTQVDSSLQENVEFKAAGTVYAIKGNNGKKEPFEHQKDAFKCLNELDKKKKFSTLLVLPTGGGKTYTAAKWLETSALDKGHKVLWIAHRQMLLEQACETFIKNSYTENMPHIASYDYRVISGSSDHDKPVNINPSDNLIIASKDSLVRNLGYLDKWLKGEDTLYFVIDEAQHSTAKSYRKIIDYVTNKVANVKLLGLTATPMRTAEKEKGLLGKIYTDGTDRGENSEDDSKGSTGMVYDIGLKELISRRILSNPQFESCYTDERYGENLGIDAMERIERLDLLPDDIANDMASNAARNKLIVDTYLKNMDEYGQTIVFAVNVLHAIALAALFNKAGVSADFVVSSIKDMMTGVTRSNEDNEAAINGYKDGQIRVLTNVNILTEGIDLPMTRTVFLARPTVSTVLMTQMVGRALRRHPAGPNKSYVVTFIDDWESHIAWGKPESLVDSGEWQDKENANRTQQIRWIAISKMEEFARILDDAIDTTKLELVPFEKRIPVGMYIFDYLEENGDSRSCQVMVYDSTKEAYENMIAQLPVLFQEFECDGDDAGEYLPDETLEEMTAQCRDTFFLGEMLPPYDESDIVRILKFYALNGEAPLFYSFDEVDRQKLDVSELARHIVDKDMRQSETTAYLNELWENGDDNILQLFFGKKTYFLRNVNIEVCKLQGGYDDADDGRNVKYSNKRMDELTLEEIRKINPALEKELRDGAFEKARNNKGQYVCACCGRTDSSRIIFQVDHIKPMAKGGLTRPNNLQILCRYCNGLKGDK